MPAHEIHLRCLADQEPLTVIRVEWGWSPADGLCVFARAVNRYDEGESVTVDRGYPVDCVPVPEHPSLGLGLVLLAGLARGRRRE